MKYAPFFAAALLMSGVAQAADIKVLSTQATEEAYKELVAQFEKSSGHKVSTIFTGTLDVQKRLAAARPMISSSWRTPQSTTRSSSARP